MDLRGALQDLLFLALVTFLVKPLGGYMERVFAGGPTPLDRVCGPVERAIYRVGGVHADREMSALAYAGAFAVFGLAGAALLFALLSWQRFLPWFFPAYMTTPMSPALAWNTAVSFSTTTTWQAYAGENTMGYCSQMAGLCAQNFLAAAAGLAVGVAFVRGLARQVCDTVGNFWVDATRALLWILLPGALLIGLLLAAQGVPVNFHPYAVATTVEGARQVIPQGPVAPLESIKNLGTNGGGFFNANGAHPYENPTPATNWIELLAIVLLPAAFTHTFGRMVGQTRQGWLLYGVMAALFAGGLFLVHHFERAAAPAGVARAGGNMEGKEVRFGIAGSALNAAVTSNAATGSNNSMDDSDSPLGSMVLLVNLLLGELVFGGLGTGLYTMVMTAAIAVFMAGLMVGRTPEYLGKKIGPAEAKMVMLFAVAAPAVILPLAALAVVLPAGLAGLTVNHGPHGLTAILFAYASCFGNNGQSFASLNANTLFYHLSTSVAMLAGRFGLAFPALAFSGMLARQRRSPETAGTLPTHSFSFGVLLAFTLLLVVALDYLPVLALGPLAERLLAR